MGNTQVSSFSISSQQFHRVTGVTMGNAQARKRIKARDFEYLAKNTRFATIELMEEEDFIKVFSIAFPARPEEKVHELAKRLSNKEGKISMANMLILFYLFCDGKLEDNLVGI